MPKPNISYFFSFFFQVYPYVLLNSTEIISMLKEEAIR